jgi:S-layer protein
MSENKTAYINAYMQTLAGEGIVLTPRLVEVFSGVLSRQLIEDAEGNITQKTNFETLAKIFTFVATPADERPASPNSYTAEQIAAAQEAAEQAVSPVDPDTFTLAEALALGEDLPDTYHIVDALVTDPVTSDVAGLEDAVAAAAENYVYSTAEQAIIDGAETVDISFDVPYILADTLANLAAAEEGVLAGAESYSLTETEFAVPEAVESTVAGLGAALAEAVTGFFTAAEQAIIDGASNGEDVTIDVPYILADTLANLAAADAEVLADAESYSLTETEFVVADSVESTVAGLDDAIAAAVDGYFTEAEQAVIDGASNGDEVVVTVASYALVDTLANIQGADADVLNGAESYTIEDTADNLVAATNVQQILILADAEAINVTGDATVAQMNELINESGYTNIGTYTLRDTAENLLAEENADIVAGAEEAFVEGEPTLTIAEYDEISAVATVEVWNIEDTAENILAAGAENAALAGADAIFATDVADLDQAFELDALGLDVGYDPYESTLEEAIDALNLPNNYTIEPATPYDAGDLTVAEAEEQLAEAEGILEGAQNADELVLANLFGYNLADTLENLAAAAEDILADAGQYALTDEAGDLGEISGDEYQLILGAANEADYTYTVEEATIVSIEADAASVTEGDDMVFTVELSHAVNVARTIEYKIEGVTTDVLNPAEPMDDFGFTFGQFDVPADVTEVTFNLTPLADSVTEGPEGFRVLLLDESLSPLENGTTDNLIVRDEEGAGRNIALTVDPDEVAPGAGNDVITGTIVNDGTNWVGTLSNLDKINPGASSEDKLIINHVSGDLSGGLNAAILGLSIMNVNTIEVNSANKFTMDSTGYAGTDLVKVNMAEDNLVLTASDTTDVTTSGTKGTITIEGGKDISVTDATAGEDILVGGTTAPEGSIMVTDSKQGTGDITIDGGTDVTVDSTITATTDAVAGGGIIVGGTTPATGAVNIAQNLTSNGGDNEIDDLTAANIAVTGGTTVDVMVDAVSTAKDESSDGDIAIGTIDITGDDNTTDVTVVQSADVTTFTKEKSGNVTETASVKFGVLKAGDDLEVAGLTFTAAQDLTAAQVAEVFSNLTDADTQDAGGPVAYGIYTGTLAGWTSASASGDTVVFTSTTADTNVGNLVPVLTNTSGNSVEPVVTTTEGAAGTAADTSANTIDYGAVTIADGGDDSIANVTVDGYANSTVASDALETLSLANSAGTMGVDTASTALDLTVNDVNHAVNLDAVSGADITNLNLYAEGAASAFVLTAAGVTDLMIDASAALDLTGSVFTALENAIIAGAGAVILDGAVDGTLAAIDASGNTGGVKADIDAATAAFTGGDGNDDLTLNSDTITEDVLLGAGNDTLTLAAGTTAGTITGTVSGGDGTEDTLAMGFADAVAVSTTTVFDTKVAGFEILEITDAAYGDDVAAQVDTLVVDLEKLVYNYVITNGTTLNPGDTDTAQDILQLNNIANDSTVVLNGDGLIEVVVKDAVAGEADTLNTVVNSAEGILTVADVETINMEAAAGDSTLALVADSVESLVITGNEFVNLSDAANYAGAAADYTTVTAGSITNAGNTLTLIDATGMTDGGLVAVADGGVAQEINAGAGADILLAAGSGDVLSGGDGDDILIGANLTELWGGNGVDTFVMNTPGNVNSYSTIMDIQSGDVIDLSNVTSTGLSFVSSAIELEDTAVFQDYANATVNQLAADDKDFAWFQYNGNTFIIGNDDQTDAVDADFENGIDSIIKIAGVVDLSTASYNMTDGTLEIA